MTPVVCKTRGDDGAECILRRTHRIQLVIAHRNLNGKRFNDGFVVRRCFSRITPMESWATSAGKGHLIPVRAEAIGVQFLTTGTNRTFHHIYDYYDFRLNASFKQDTFEASYHSSLRWRSEVTRVDGVPSQTSSRFLSLDPYTDMYDFNSGLQYYIDRTTWQCSVSHINNTFPAYLNTTAANISGEYVLTLRKPDPIFYGFSDYTYSGKRTKRGIQCDCWAAVDYVHVAGNPVASPVNHEICFMSSTIEDVTAGSSLLRNVPVQTTLYISDLGRTTTYNYFDYNVGPWDVSVFDISNCYDKSKHLRFQLQFPGTYDSKLHHAFVISAQKSLSTTMRVRPLRVQGLHLESDQFNIYLSATLLAMSPVEETVDNAGPEGPIIDAITTLQVAVQQRVFVVVVQADGNTVLLVYFPTLPLYELPIPVSFLADAKRYEEQRQNTSRLHSVATDNALASLNHRQGHIYKRTLPPLPNEISYRLELTVPSANTIQEADIYYDYDANIVRYDSFASNSGPPLYTNSPLTEIHDFNSGIVYTIDKLRGNCTISRINDNQFDSDTDVSVVFDTGAYVIKMRTPGQIFYLDNTNYVYAGQKTVRGMLCDVFEGNRSDFQYPGINKPFESNFRYFFLSPDWRQVTDNSNTPVTSQPVRLDILGLGVPVAMTYNFFNFQKNIPNLSNFNIGRCFHDRTQRRLATISFPGRFYHLVQRSFYDFRRNLRQQLSKTSGASQLRFQDMRLYIGQSGFYATVIILDQEPPELDFTYIEQVNTTGYMTVHPQVSTYQSCASFCRNETSFVCEGFDFCSSESVCLLNSWHGNQDKGKTMHTFCDHYSRTANVSSTQPSLDRALINIRNSIYSKKFNVTIYSTASQGIVVPATSLSFANPVGRFTPGSSPFSHTVALQHFQRPRRNQGFKTATASFDNLAVDECAQACLSEPAFDCHAMEYCFPLAKCYLTSVLPEDSSLGFIVSSPACAIFTRNYTDDYQAIVGRTVAGKSAEVHSNIPTANSCAKLCTQSQTINCKGFDYCGQTCRLSAVHFFNTPTGPFGTSLSCTHYSRRYADDFTKKSKQTINQQGLITQMNGTSIDQCATACVGNAGTPCWIFTYCPVSRLCKLFSVLPKTSTQYTVHSDTCDLYVRPVVQNTKHSVTSTATCPTTNPVTQGLCQNGSGGSGYSGGAMAGLAFGMLFVGCVLAAVILFLIGRRQTGQQNDQLNLELVESTGS
ncbi:hypothetical protein ScPMuIL_001646 [Solemya velum]